MNIHIESPFSKEDLKQAKYRQSKAPINSWCSNLKPALEKLLDNQAPDWRSLNGTIILKGVKSTGKVKIDSSSIPDPKSKQKNHT
jgi:hypothetical protein